MQIIVLARYFKRIVNLKKTISKFCIYCWIIWHFSVWGSENIMWTFIQSDAFWWCESAGHVEWTDKSRRQCLVMWRTPSEWGKLIYGWVKLHFYSR